MIRLKTLVTAAMFASLPFVASAQLPSGPPSAAANGIGVIDQALPPLDDVDAFKAGSGIPGSLFTTLEAWRPKAPPTSDHPLRGVVLSMTVGHDKSTDGTGTSTLSIVPGHPGYLVESKSQRIKSLTSTGSSLSYRGIFALDARMATSSGNEGRGSNVRSVLSKVVVPEDFDKALTPGGSWTYTLVFRSTMRSSANVDAPVVRQLVTERHCVNSATRPSAELSSALRGAMVEVRCTRDDQPDSNWLTFAYLQDEGIFLPLQIHQAVPPNGAAVINNFRVERVER